MEIFFIVLLVLSISLFYIIPAFRKYFNISCKNSTFFVKNNLILRKNAFFTQKCHRLCANRRNKNAEKRQSPTFQHQSDVIMHKISAFILLYL